MSRPALEWTVRRARDFDSVIVGGDLARGGGQGFVPEYLGAVLSANKSVFFVHGNADSPDAVIPTGVVGLHGRRAELGGFSLGGIGGSSPTGFGTPFELDDERAESILEGIGRVDVLVSHCPPVNTKCDMAGGAHIGSAPVRAYVLRSRPALVLSGHAHDSRGIDKIGDTTVVNPGPLMEGNFAVVDLRNPISAELKNEKF